MTTLLIRADGGARIGTGHVMRCLALAQQWRRHGGRVVFLQAESSPALVQRLTEQEVEVVRFEAGPGSDADARRTSAEARARGASWIVADGYAFGSGWQHLVKAEDGRLLLLDDYGHARHYCADVILNQNLAADPKLYADREQSTQVLLGPRYALLRQEFQEWRNWRREIAAGAQKVLVTMGGGDSGDTTGMVIDALAQLPKTEAVVVVGGSNPKLAELTAAIGRRQSKVRLVANASNMPQLMAWADVAVAGAGSTCWELAFMGLPCLFLVLADNQRGVAQAADRHGTGRNMGEAGRVEPESLARALDALLLDGGQRERMSRAGRTLIDGHGAGRVATRLLARGLGIRRANEADSRMIWTWANEAGARQASFSSDPIPWDQHVRWFSAKTADEQCFFYVGFEDGGAPVGQVRFDVAGSESVISVSLAPAMRGRGYGSALIVRGVQQFFVESRAEVIHAYVKPENQVSLRAFERADFAFAADTQIRGQTARQLVFTRKAHDH